MNTHTNFQNPEVIRNGTDIAYKFNILNSQLSSTIQLKPSDNQVFITQSLGRSEGLSAFYDSFLIFSNKFFTKKYTLDAFEKYVKHNVTLPQLGTKSVTAKFTPDYFYFTQKGILLNWSCQIIAEDKSDDFEFPELVEARTAPASPAVQNTAKMAGPFLNDLGLEEVNEIAQISDAPLIDIADEDENSDNILSDMSRSLERSKVREARLKARLARLKAERTTEKYLSKYGATYSDLDDSEPETEVEDSEDNDSEGEN